MKINFKIITSAIVLLCYTNGFADSDNFDSFLKPLFEKNCNQCHGKKKTKGKVNLFELKTYEQFIDETDLIKEVIEAVDANDMPPEDEPQLKPQDRLKLIAALKDILRSSASHKIMKETAFKRLNRFQYNYTVKDLFKLNRDLFHLPEKMMTRQVNYLARPTDKMPDKVNVHCASLRQGASMSGVDSFPQDHRANHGFDNQSDQLTLAPILLDSFLKLSLSIVNSPDFNPRFVGIWNEFFREPKVKGDVTQEIQKRLKPFLSKAFRRSVDQVTLQRYTDYTAAKIKAGLSFTEAMKKVASAVLASPLFIHSINSIDPKEKDYNLASKLSYFLWGSGPDETLLKLAAKGELHKKKQLEQAVDRMLKDLKVERFLDSFPSQWMQLEAIFSARPDPKIYRNFSLDKKKPLSSHMVIEPLLLFDTVFIENRPLMDLIKPDFSYQNNFLKKWYSLNDKTVDLVKQAADDKKSIAARIELRKKLNHEISQMEKQTAALLKPYKIQYLKEKKAKNSKVAGVTIKPYASWDFNENLNDSVSSLHLKAHGKIRFKDGMVVLDKAFLKSKILPIELKEKTLEVWFMLNTAQQKGGGVMTVQGPNDFFDSIVYGEKKPMHWISGSNGHSRTRDFVGARPDKVVKKMTHLVMVYDKEGNVKLYHNGRPYGKSYKTQLATFPKNQTKILFGLRHLPAAKNKFLNITIDHAKLYNRALNAAEIKAVKASHDYISEGELQKHLSKEDKKSLLETKRKMAQTLKKLNANPLFDDKTIIRDRQNRADESITGTLNSNTFHRVSTTDPRYGGIITNAAVLTMTSAPKRTQPITRGAWVIEVVLNDPPPPPPNDVPALDEEGLDKGLTIKETFAEHRKNPDCAGCHSRLDPLGFVLESFDGVGLWRDQYRNKRKVDPTGVLLKKYPYKNIVDFKDSLAQEKDRFAKAFIRHLLRFALARNLSAGESILIDEIAEKTKKDNYKLQSIIKEVILSKSFSGA